MFRTAVFWYVLTLVAVNHVVEPLAENPFQWGGRLGSARQQKCTGGGKYGHGLELDTDMGWNWAPAGILVNGHPRTQAGIERAGRACHRLELLRKAEDPDYTAVAEVAVAEVSVAKQAKPRTRAVMGGNTADKAVQLLVF